MDPNEQNKRNTRSSLGGFIAGFVLYAVLSAAGVPFLLAIAGGLLAAAAAASVAYALTARD